MAEGNTEGCAAIASTRRMVVIASVEKGHASSLGCFLHLNSKTPRKYEAILFRYISHAAVSGLECEMQNTSAQEVFNVPPLCKDDIAFSLANSHARVVFCVRSHTSRSRTNLDLDIYTRLRHGVGKCRAARASARFHPAAHCCGPEVKQPEFVGPIRQGDQRSRQSSLWQFAYGEPVRGGLRAYILAGTARGELPRRARFQQHSGGAQQSVCHG